MLGVLAIIGVLSVAGIAGYTRAMEKWKINKTIDQVVMIVTNVRNLFVGTNDFSTLNTKAYSLGLFPNDMMKKSETEAYSALGETVQLAGYSKGWGLSILLKTRAECMALTTQNWGEDKQVKFIEVMCGTTGVTHYSGHLSVDDAEFVCKNVGANRASYGPMKGKMLIYFNY